MFIGEKDLDQHVVVVAEIGNNHEGDFAVACELVRQAVACGVDAVKFQTLRAEQLVSPKDEARFRRLKGFELTPAQFGELSRLARSLGVLFISTPLDLGSADVLEPLVDAFKIASGDNDFFPLIAKVARTAKPMIVSTGSSDLERVGAAVACVRDIRGASTAQGLVVTHCVSCYPTPAEQANLRAIPALASEFGVVAGYSDHTLGVEACVLATAAGARLIEKHFTLDHNYSDFRDHQLSADPGEMTDLVRRVRQAAAMYGTGGKRIQDCERESAPAIRRSVVANRDLPTGHRIAFDDLAWIRPAGGLAPGREDEVVGRRLKRAIAASERLSTSDVE